MSIRGRTMKRILNKFIPDTETGEFLKQALEDRNLTMKDVLHGYMYIRWPKATSEPHWARTIWLLSLSFTSLVASPKDKKSVKNSRTTLHKAITEKSSPLKKL